MAVNILAAKRTMNSVEPILLRSIRMDLGSVQALGYKGKLCGSLLCSANPPNHPQAHEIQEIHSKWCISHKLLTEKHVKMLNFCELWANCLHQCSPEAATVLPDYCAMFTILDDTAEKYIQTGEPGPVEDAFGCFDELWQTGKCEDRPDYPKFSPLKSAISSLRERILLKASSEQYSYFCEGMKSYHDGVIEQIYFAKHKHQLTPATQRLNRTINVAFAPTIELLSIFQGTKANKSIRQHPFFNRVYWSICSLGGLANDIISFPKETYEFEDDCCSQYHNFINAAIPEKKESDPLQASVNEAFEVHNKDFKEAVQLGALLCEDYPEFLPFMETILDTHVAWVAWCLHNPRYLKYCEKVQLNEITAHIYCNSSQEHKEEELKVAH